MALLSEDENKPSDFDCAVWSKLISLKPPERHSQKNASVVWPSKSNREEKPQL